MLNKTIRYFLENKLITFLLLAAFIVGGFITAPFNWETSLIERNPVPVDAIPDIGENQQIVFTEWMGQSPQDIEDQITYPLTTSLLGIPGVKTIRSNSIFGLSSIYIIFNEDVDFYWSRTRILEKLNSLPPGTVPNEVTPALGPDATALGQVYWYTLEGRDPKTGKATGGWDPQELRTIQDFYVRYYLTAASGVSEVASIGGFLKEYQVEIDPDAMKANNVDVGMIMKAVKDSNLDIGARTLEFNKVEYLVRGLGYIKNLSDLEESVVTVRDNVPIRLKDVAKIQFGPAGRRGGLDKSGVEAVGGVVVARYGANPQEVIHNLKSKIDEVAPGLPSKVLADGTVSKVTIVPFYDRSGLIQETLGTLESSLSHEILISILVVIVLVLNLRASVLISSILPVGVLMTFILMKYFGVDANIVALSGIAIAIGVMIDVGIVFTENIVRHLEMPENEGVRGKKLIEVIYVATVEVASAVITALATTVVSFLPVFAMQAAEGKLFKPLAWTKTFALISALFIGIMFIPALAKILFSIRINTKRTSRIFNGTLIGFGFVFLFAYGSIIAIALIAIGINNLLTQVPEKTFLKGKIKLPYTEKIANYINIAITIIILVYFLTIEWMPLGASNSVFVNFIFVTLVISLVLGALMAIVHFYKKILSWCLDNKWKFLMIPILVVFFGVTIWLGFGKVLGFMPEFTKNNVVWEKLDKNFPGLGNEFMPALNEGSFLLMPTTMPHSSITENTEVIASIDKHVMTIPEIESSVGKWGRVNSALDPAPTSMYENTINYIPEYILDEDGHRERFKVNKYDAFVLKDGTTYAYGTDEFRKITKKELILDEDGENFRQWREHIKKPDDIWNEIVKHAKFPGLTSAPKLQPIQTRLIMLATGMRAPMGIKVFGPTLEAIEKVGFELENILKEVPSVNPPTVFADRVVGKPYLEIKLNRQAMSRYGLSVKDMQMQLSVAVGGKQLSTTVEGRERFPVRVRYAREFRDNPDDIKKILIPTPAGVQVELGELASLEYVRGPQVIKSEDTFLTGYVIFDMKDGYAETNVVEDAQALIKKKIDSGEFKLPDGVTYRFTGNYENQIRASKRLMIVVPISLIVILLILYFQFKSMVPALMVFSGIFVAFAGGFIMIWLYGQGWFLNFDVFGVQMRDLFQLHTINLSVAVWVGFIALFGIATDDGVIMGTYLTQVFDKRHPDTVKEIRASVIAAGSKRVRPAMMTAATAIIALIPVLTATGKGADVVIPMAIPSFGGMLLQVMTMFVVPVLYSMWKEKGLKKQLKSSNA
ncbi:Cu(I)/Ag(I) efflux system membrane protein CusA/SilA [Flaviramulus basaltis]|uniref:Cu(I)/Ag(I) efflux system membrane protein CusA/SilA n=1 Tax=Flaviramulus basaltis TaxID=369401 RepID=A0A1K2IQS4_9FLAO|nr:efflux RND transporter permease subunit [Flaviramulus basaltis]SFZ94788.1 Cu(I)/Ag(I) efflux system membrane protein CusA/SilA [Flaviramulus basaltis]